MSENDYQEKRRFARIPIETPVTFTMDESDNVEYHATSQNLSAGGIYMTTSHAAKLGDFIKVVLHASEKNGAPLVAEGKVVRCKLDKKNNDLFHISVQFSEEHESWVQINTAN